jgi:thioredoxin-related protein
MKLRALVSAVFLLLFVSTATHAANEAVGKLTGGEKYVLPGWFKDSFLEMSEDASEAAEADRHLMLFMHLDECPYCSVMLQESFTQAQFVPWLRGRFDVVGINIRGDREVAFNEQLTVTEKELAETLGVRQTPAIIFLDSANKAVMRSDGYRSQKDFKRILDYVDSKSYLSTDLNGYITKTSGGPHYEFRTHSQFSSNRDLSAGEAPVMVIFEDGYCDSCDLMHDTLLRDETANALMAQMTVVRLNANATSPITKPDGEQTTPKAWIKELGLAVRPAIVMVDGPVELVRIAGVLRRYHFQTALRYVAKGKYHNYPTLRDFSRAQRAQLLAAGHVIDLGAQ